MPGENHLGLCSKNHSVTFHSLGSSSLLEHFQFHRSGLLRRRILELFRDALAPFAKELVHVAHESSQVLLVVLRQRREEFVQKSKEFEA